MLLNFLRFLTNIDYLCIASRIKEQNPIKNKGCKSVLKCLMTSNSTQTTRRKWALAICLIFVIAAGVYTFFSYYVSSKNLHVNMAHVEVYSQYELMQDGKTILAFHTDTIKGGACFAKKYAFLPYSETQLVAVFDSTIWQDVLKGMDPQMVLESQIESLDSIYKDSKWKVGELDYYERSHNVTDEGYNMVCQYAAKEKKIYQRAQKLLDSLKHFRIIEGDKLHKETNEKDKQAKDTIKKVNRLKLVHSLHFVAVYQGNDQKWKRINCAHLSQSQYEGAHLFLLQTTHKKGDIPTGISMQQAAKFARIYSVTFHHHRNYQLYADSLGYYQGDTNLQKQPHGHGSWNGYDGTYYEGSWKDGERSGFGFSIAPKKPLRVGEWKNDHYKGERLVYTSDRIYGIDISKYQHVIGKHTYPINWKALRISHLGNISKKNVNGDVNFPISFIYIKSTEGSSMLNPFYKSDYLAARAHGFKVGSYHFFSPNTPASMQARQFLRRSILRKGDLPPVLDVEPTKEQIKKMGGIGVLFGRVRTWLRFVEREVGVKPVLYISQGFVNKYLNQAPDLKHNYPIWIARYGEFKPDIHLIYWQLCPDGRVSGIHGHVDINVFNGYKDTYNKFISTETIK